MGFPSPEQKRVIEHRGKPLVVVAGPGTGKTKTLVERAKAILKDNPANNLVFLTFTRASRRDTKSKLGDLPNTQVSTIHTYAKSIVHCCAGHVGLDSDFHVLIEAKGEDNLLIEEALMDAGVNCEPKEIKQMILRKRSKGELKPPLNISDAQASTVLKAFKTLYQFYNSPGMYELVPLALRILKDFPELLEPIYFHVDEYQDLNKADQTLIKLIAKDTRHQVVVVGDDAQSIYGRRYANYKGIKEIYEDDKWEHADFKDCHRLPSHILRASQELLIRNTRIKYLGQLAIPPDDGKRVRLLQFSTAKVELRGIAAAIQNITMRMKKKDGTSFRYNDIMVLCPSKTIVKNFADALKHEGIEVRLKEKCVIPDDQWKVLLLLRFVKHDDSLALRQWLDPTFNVEVQH